VNSTLIATAAGLVTAVAWGWGDWLTPRSKHKLSIWQINFVVNLMGSACMLVILAFSAPHLLTGDQALKIVGASALICIGFVMFVKALTVGAVGIVVPLSSIYPMVTLILSIIFLHQIFAHLQIAGMIIIVLGAVLLAYEKNQRQLPLRVQHRAAGLTMMAVLLWGIGFFILNPLVAQVRWQVLLAGLEFSGLFLSTLYMLVVYKSGVVKAARLAVANPAAVGSGLLLEFGAIALYLGAGRIKSIIIPAVISSLSPLIATTLEVAIDKKKLGVLKRLGAIIAVGEKVVVYVALYDHPEYGSNAVWDRSVAGFLESLELDGEMKPRFRFVREEP